jgi:GAF domain-containing protein
MLRENELIGSFTVYRQEVRPFTGKQIELIENFAAQAVIAIENARLLNELRQRTIDLSERTADLTAALEHQTATSEVLQVIGTSPGNLVPVFATMVENAVRICHANWGNIHLWDGETLHLVATHNVPPAFAAFRTSNPHYRPHPKALFGRLAATQTATQIADCAAVKPLDPVHVAAVELGGARTALGVPMLKENQMIGAFALIRQEVRPFTEKQIALVENFAAQAVIAIENARLLNELRQRTTDLTERTADLTEALEQQTATTEVLRVISTSPGDLKPVFQTMLENATRICEAKFGTLFRFDGKRFYPAADVGTPPELSEYMGRPAFQPLPGGHLDRVLRTKQLFHTADDTAEAVPGPAARLAGARSTLCVPMLKDDALIGAIVIYRQEVRPFTDKQIELLTNFAAQAAIAIENTRLLNELRQSLEQQTATAEVLRVISSSWSQCFRPCWRMRRASVRPTLAR